MQTFALYPIVDGRCGCGDPTCTDVGKHPAERWRTLPDRPELTPTATQGVGIATGERSGVFVVDLDVKNGVDGVANFGALGDVPPTYTVATPSGGFHLYFRHPGFPVRNSGPKSNPIAPGVDIRGDGGYVVAPGSPHKSGGRYEVASTHEIATAPAWLLAWLGLRRSEAELAAPATETEERVSKVPKEWRIARAKEWLKDQPPAIQGQGGDAHTFTLVTRAVHDCCLTDADMITEAFVEWNARCEPPWTGKEWMHKIDSALNHSTVPWKTFEIPIQYAEDRAGKTAPAPAGKRPSAAERALRIGGQDVARLTTGLKTLDAATRGGILQKKLCVVGGAPGAGKTALLVQLAYRWLTAGVHTAILAADEDADALLIRLGQQCGLSRDALENGDPKARAELAAWCASVPLLLVDGDEEDATIESVSLELKDAAAGNRSALLVDSMQTARSLIAVPRGADLRVKINASVQALKKSAKVDGHVVIASSELSKAAYRNKAQSENINALAAFKESGDIEYGAALAIALTGVQGTSELVDASVVKNRLGHQKPDFVLKLDHERAGVEEANLRDIQMKDPNYFIKTEIKTALEQAAGVPLSRNLICAKVGGNRAVTLSAIRELLSSKEIHEDTVGKGGLRLPIPGDPGYQESNS